MCARPLPTNHSLCQSSAANTNSHMHLRGESGHLKSRAFVFPCLLRPPSVFLLFAQFSLFESLQMCSYAKENRQQASGFG